MPAKTQLVIWAVLATVSTSFFFAVIYPAVGIVLLISSLIASSMVLRIFTGEKVVHLAAYSILTGGLLLAIILWLSSQFH